MGSDSFNLTSWNDYIGTFDDNPCPPQQIEQSLNVFGLSTPAIQDAQEHRARQSFSFSFLLKTFEVFVIM